MKAVALKPNLFSIAVLLAMVSGLVVGSAFPSRVQAANFWELWHDIPVGSATGQTASMNCGWHSVCVSPWTSGSALDWEETNQYAYFAGAAKWNGGFLRVAVQATRANAPNYNGSSCKNVTVEIRNYHTGAFLAREVFTHVSRGSTATYNVWANTTPQPFRVIAGDVATTELQNCSFGGSHVHQYGMSFTATNGGYPSASSCHTNGCASYANNTWVHYESWNY